MSKEIIPKELKEIPIFQNEEEEREFWAKEDSTEYIDWGKSEAGDLPKLKPTKSITRSRLRRNQM